MSSTRSNIGPLSAEFTDLPTSPVIAEVRKIRVRSHARLLRGSRSLSEAADLVGLNKDELRRIEKGETLQIRFETIAKLLSAYNCTLDELLEVEVVEEKAKDSIYEQALRFYVTNDDYPVPPLRRSVRRSESFDMQDDAEFAAFVESNDGQETPRRRRAPLGISL